MDPTGFHFIENAIPTQDNAIKILAKLMRKYLPAEDETGYFAWENAAQELRIHPERLAATAEAASEVIRPYIELAIEETSRALKDIEGAAYETNTSTDYIEQGTINAPDLTDLFDVVKALQHFDNENLVKAHKKANSAIHDLRSLERAVQAILEPTKPEITTHDALLTIMRCAPD